MLLKVEHNRDPLPAEPRSEQQSVHIIEDEYQSISSLVY